MTYEQFLNKLMSYYNLRDEATLYDIFLLRKKVSRILHRLFSSKQVEISSRIRYKLTFNKTKLRSGQSSAELVWCVPMIT